MRDPTPHRKLSGRAVAVGVASALGLAACGASGDVEAVADLRTADGQVGDAASDESLASTIPAAAPPIDSEQVALDDGDTQAPGLPVASAQVEAPVIAEPAENTNDDGAADGTATTQSPVTTTTPAASETTAAPTTQLPSTTQAPTTTPPAAANLPNLAVIDIASGSSVGFPQAAQAGGLPVLLWFWSPT